MGVILIAPIQRQPGLSRLEFLKESGTWLRELGVALAAPSELDIYCSGFVAVLPIAPNEHRQTQL
jgi:hypothetical protein